MIRVTVGDTTVSILEAERIGYDIPGIYYLYDKEELVIGVTEEGDSGIAFHYITETDAIPIELPSKQEKEEIWYSNQHRKPRSKSS